MQPHPWREPHPIQTLMQPQWKADFDTIKPQLEYNPTHVTNILNDKMDAT